MNDAADAAAEPSHATQCSLAEPLADAQTEPTHATENASPLPRSPLDGRSSSFSGHATIAISSATLWRNKQVSCEAIRSFEATRKAQIDVFQEKDRVYWQAFEKELLRAREENARLQRFFVVKIQADLAYAESLRRIRQVLERPSSAASSSNLTAPGSGGQPGSSGGHAGADQFALVSTCARALNTLGEVQQQLSEKIVQFTNVIKRDVITRPLDEMVATFEERTTAMLADGNRFDAMLHDAQRAVLDAFAKYDTVYREMEADRHASTSRADLWLAEVAYCISVQKLQQARIEYVKGMSALFQQYKSLEVMRTSVIQTAVETYTRKQRLLYDELGGAMAEPLSAAQRIDPDRDLAQSVRRLPKNFTAAALSSENTDQKLFSALRSPISSPLLVRCGFLKHQVTGSLFRSWKDVLCVITQDQFMHLIDLKENTNRTVTQSVEAILDAIYTSEQTSEIVCTTIALPNCRLTMIGKSAVPTFEVTESSQATGLLGAVFRMDSTRKFTFQCPTQSDLIDWVVAAKRFIPPGASSITAQ